VLGQEKESLFLVSDFWKFCGCDWGWKRGDVELRANYVVEIAGSADAGGFVVLDSEEEEFFWAEDDLYGVESLSVGSRVKELFRL